MFKFNRNFHVSAAFLLMLLSALTLAGCGNNKEMGKQAQIEEQSILPSEEDGKEQREQQKPADALYDGELEAAEKLGFSFPEAALTESCSEKQFYELMGKVISLRDATPDETWEKMAAKASDEPILRAYAARALYFTICQTDYEVDPEIAEERGYFEFGATEANDWLRSADGDDCIMVDNVTDFSEFGDKLIEMDGGWNYVEGERDTIPTDWTISFCIQQTDKNTGYKVMELDEEGRFLPFEQLSIKEAVKSAYRLYRSIEKETIREEEPVYVRLEDIKTALIAKESYQENPHDLPEVSVEKLPAWRGTGYLSKFNSKDYHEFSESDIRFLGENGFNYVRLMFGFSTLQAPDYPLDFEMVNEKELEKLDELISWGIKYGVHIQICMHGQPGRHYMENFEDPETGEYIVTENYQSGKLYPTEEEWRLIGAYWEMLARRYADIPNRFLTFDLMNEWSIPKEQAAQFAGDWQKVIELIRKEDGERVLVASFDQGASIEAVEAIASKQVAISYHFYSPGRICHYGASYIEKQYPYLQSPEWPMAYFPCTLESESGSLTIQGSCMDNYQQLTVYLSDAEWQSRVDILADGVLLETIRPEDGRQYDKYTQVTLQPGTKEITLEAKSGMVRIGMLAFSGEGTETALTPHDVFSTGTGRANGMTLEIREDGSFCNSEGRVYGAQDVYEEYLAPYVKLAEKCHVGIMVNEFGIFGGAYIDGDTVYQYYKDIRKVFEEHGIGFALCELNGGINLKSEWDNFSQFRGNPQTERVVYEYPGEVFRADIFYVDNRLLRALTED